MGDNYYFVSVGTLIGVVFGIFISCVLIGKNHINISDAEFYRFCMSRNITLEDCIIPGKLLDGAKTDDR